MLLAIAPAFRAAQPAAVVEAGVTGRVLAPDGSPVTLGNVALMTSSTHRVSATIDRTGHFGILPDSPGWQRLFISVPGFAPHRLHVTVPLSRTMALPAITLLEATYFHARFVTADGEPLPAGGLRRRFIDRDGRAIADPLDHVREQIEADGSVTLGPLPPGKVLLAFARPGLAQTRLRDLDVTGTKPLIEGGTITIERGARLQVDVIDGGGTPVPRHDVWIEDAVQPSPLFSPAIKTDEQGRAVLDSLASGRYRVWTRTADRCNGQQLTMSRLVTTGGSGTARTRLVIGGRASFRIASALGPVAGRGVSLSPDSPPQSPWQARLVESMPPSRRLPIVPTSSSSCSGVTDGDGRVAMAPFPPGPAQLRVRLFNSAYSIRVTVPESGSEMVIAIPDGLTPARVTDQITLQPVAAQVVWVGGGGRVEASATPNGDVLLEGVGKTGGTLTISARDYQTLEGQFNETPETHQEVALMPSPAARLTVRVVADSGEAIANAVVQLFPRGAGDVAEFVSADARGVATFSDLPTGPLQFSASADRYVSAAVRIAEENRAGIVIALARAPRVP